MVFSSPTGTGPVRADVPAIIGRSPWAQSLRAQIVRVAVHDSTVLVTGPTGTGKELIARALHDHSARAAGPFIPVDCTAISGTLFASQLFGHRKGAYTGANYEALGCFRAADRGTIFLDEIGDLELDLQAKLLRVLQERVVIPVGGHASIPIDVRVVAATNRDLKQEVASGRFREDLYYRLAVVPVESAPLAARAEDIAPLAEHFLRQLSEKAGFPPKTLSPGAIEALEQFPWPGNVRQLRHFLEQAVVACDGSLIGLALVQSLLEQSRLPQRRTLRPLPVQRHELLKPAPLPSVASTNAGTFEETHSLRRVGASASANAAWATLAEVERRHILQTLERTYYNQSATARLLGITRQSLLRKVKKFGLTLPRPAR